MGEEIWRWIPGYKGLYEVSNRGRVRSYHRHRLSNPHYMQAQKTIKGYMKINLRHSVNRSSKHHFVHGLVAAAFIGERPEGYTVNHINGIKDDNRPENLEY